MTGRAYVHVPPRGEPRALIHRNDAVAARFYARLLTQALRYGMPSRRRLGAARALVARTGVPVAALAGALRFLPARPAPHVDALVAAAAASWDRFRERLPTLPPRPAHLGALALPRSAGLTVFLFGEGPGPLVVLKAARTGSRGVEREAAALDEAAPSAVGPVPLGPVGDARAQEGVDGEPLRVEPVRPTTATSVAWSSGLATIADALARLAAATGRAEPAVDLPGPVERAIDDGPISAAGRAALRAAWRDVRSLRRSVLVHGDTSPQNCLLAHGRFRALVDWERARSGGCPGLDALNAALAFLEHGVGLARWSEERAVRSFERAWASPFGDGAREAVRRAAAAGGVPDRLLEPLEVVAFGYRVGRRILRPAAYATGPRATARMLEIACGF